MNSSSTSVQLKLLLPHPGNGPRDTAKARLEAIRALARKDLARPSDLARFHDALCVLRAYPDSQETLDLVERVLEGFHKRRDLRRFRRDLADTGIAGTTIQFSFFWFTALWLARRWPERISIVWSEFENKEKLIESLPLILPYWESPALDELSFTPRQWINLLKGPGETDAVFLIRRFEAMRCDSPVREQKFEELDVPIRISPGPDSPSRTRAKYLPSPVVFQDYSGLKNRPSLRSEIMQRPASAASLPLREAEALIDLARESMVTRRRDLDAFEHADKNDIRLIDGGNGYQLALIGVKPERRLMLEALYGGLHLKNGVPVGYMLVSTLFNSAAVMYNIFETYRGIETAGIFTRMMAIIRDVFGADAFVIDPFQLGYGNAEGLKSGAWWFYYKMGFRPSNPDVKRVLKEELKKKRSDPRYRSSAATLTELSSEPMYLYLGPEREDVLGRFEIGNLGLAVSKRMAARFASDLERATREASRECARLLGVRSLRGFTHGERLAWERWSPLVVSIDGVTGWPRSEKRALVRIIRAKGGRRESDFVRLFDGHKRVRKAILKLAEDH